MDQINSILKHHKLKKTPVRVQVLGEFLNAKRALSKKDIEEKFDKIDRITLYRTLKSFEEKGLIHKAVDGSDKIKFALCHNGCTAHNHMDSHAHFHCNECGQTFCIDEIPSPSVQAPKGFTLGKTHLVLAGKCDKC